MLSPRSKEAFEKVNNLVTQEFKVKVDDLCSRIRTKTIVEAKFVAWYVLHTEYRRAFVVIGQMYGNKHYTTIGNGVNRVRNNQDLLSMAKKISDILNENKQQ